MIDPSLPRTSSSSVGVSRHHARKSPAEIERNSCDYLEAVENAKGWYCALQPRRTSFFIYSDAPITVNQIASFLQYHVELLAE